MTENKKVWLSYGKNIARLGILCETSMNAHKIDTVTMTSGPNIYPCQLNKSVNKYIIIYGKRKKYMQKRVNILDKTLLQIHKRYREL